MARREKTTLRVLIEAGLRQVLREQRGPSRGHPLGTTPRAAARPRPGPPSPTGILPRMDLTSLPDEIKELVRAQLESGRFQSVDDVVCEALRLLHEREELFASHREELRAQIAEGVAAEERGEFRDGGEAIADVRHRIDERLRRGE